MKNFELNVIYEDNHVVVVIKPENVPSQEDETGDFDMLSAVKKFLKEKYNKMGNAYAGLIHRLDRPTGGIMVFAKTSKASARLCEQIKTGIFNKEYLTVVEGQLNQKTKKVINYLKKDEQNNIVKVVPMSEVGAKKAELIYDVLEVLNIKFQENKNQTKTIDNEKEQNKGIQKKLSLVKINLLTGRSHQIRVQMANLKTPVFGDGKYGAKYTKTKELALWAYKVEFVHPTTKQKMSFKVLPNTNKMPWKFFNLSKI